MENKKTIPQYKEFFFTCYEEPSEEMLLLLGVTEYAYIKHDKDIWSEDTDTHKKGDIKDSHYHCYIKLRAKKTLNSVRNIILKNNNSQDFLINQCTNKISALRYLTHEDDSDKYHYDLSEIKTNMNLSYIYLMELTDEAFIYQVLQLCESEEIKTFRQLTYLAIAKGKLELIMSKAYFFKSILKGE